MRSWVGLCFLNLKAWSNLGTLLYSVEISLETDGILNCEVSPSTAWQMSLVIFIKIEMSSFIGKQGILSPNPPFFLGLFSGP